MSPSVTPMVTVIIPAFNRAEWLSVSIDSVLSQTFEDWELIIIDDRSTDHTKKVAEEFALRDSRICVSTSTHKQGPSGARNHGIERAKGKYIALLDSDDEWEPFHLKQMVYYLERYPERIDLMTANPLRKRHATGEVYNYDELDLDAVPHHRVEEVYLLKTDDLFNVAMNSRILTTQTIVAKRELFDKISWDEDIGAGEDCLFPLEVAYQGFHVGHLQSYHVTYWAHDDNLSNCNQRHTPTRMIPVLHGFVNLQLTIMSKFKLTREQQLAVRKKLANLYVWELGYNCYSETRDFKNARKFYLKGLKLKPQNFTYWKVYATSYLKEYYNRK